MGKDNPVFQNLVTTGNQAIAAVGTDLSALAVGQIGFFNLHSNKAIDGSIPADSEQFFLAVGQADSAGGPTKINFSAGQYIPKRRGTAITAKGYIAPLPKIIEVTGFNAKCESNYALKIEFRSQKIYGQNGFNQFAKTFGYYTGCCVEVDCASCPQGNPNELAVGLVANINKDPDALVVASMFVNVLQATVVDPTADGTFVFTIGTESFSVPVLAADTATTAAAKLVAFVNAVTTSAYVMTSSAAVIKAYPKFSKTANTATFAFVSGPAGAGLSTITSTNTSIADAAAATAFTLAAPGAAISIRLTGAGDAATAMNSGIPIKYYNPRGLDMIVSLVDGFNCNGTVTTTQELQYEEGAGEEVQNEEYMAGGWNGKPGPYRTSAVTGLPRQNLEYSAVAATKYCIFTFEYDLKSTSGWKEYESSLRTNIYMPCADGTTIVAFWTVADLIFTQFGGMTNDVATMDCTNTTINVINDRTLDGIEVLA